MRRGFGRMTWDVSFRPKRCAGKIMTARQRHHTTNREDAVYAKGEDQAFLAKAWIEYFFSQADGARSDLDQLIVSNELDGLFQAQNARRNQTDRLVCSRCSHVGQFLFFHNIYVHVLIARILSDDHALVDLSAWCDEN